MSAPESIAETASQPEAQPLSPEALALLKRARRGFGVSVGILLLGFIAIGGALVYRATRDSGGPSTTYSVQSLALPSGAQILSAVAADGLVTITYSIDAVTQLRLYDGKTGEMQRQMDLLPEVP
jgi:hypothetical protein